MSASRMSLSDACASHDGVRVREGGVRAGESSPAAQASTLSPVDTCASSAVQVQEWTLLQGASDCAYVTRNYSCTDDPTWELSENFGTIDIWENVHLTISFA